MKIILPWPDAKLNPNRSKGMHWGGTAALRKKAKNDAFWLTRGALMEHIALNLGVANRAEGAAVAVVITFVQPDRRARDRDNLLAALKPSLDGVAGALGIDDSNFDPVTIRREYGAKPGSVIVEVA